MRYDEAEAIAKAAVHRLVTATPPLSGTTPLAQLPLHIEQLVQERAAAVTWLAHLACSYPAVALHLERALTDPDYQIPVYDPKDLIV